jgi:hypothetical protein
MVRFTAVAVHLPPLLVRTLSAFNRTTIAFRENVLALQGFHSLAALLSGLSTFLRRAAVPLRWYLRMSGALPEAS